jgi:hypothetical protein
MKTTPGTQRLFQHIDGRHVLLSKAGVAVSFWIDEQNQVQLVERLNDVDFKGTGTQLKREGWKCVGPGMEYAWLLEDQESS